LSGTNFVCDIQSRSIPFNVTAHYRTALSRPEPLVVVTSSNVTIDRAHDPGAFQRRCLMMRTRSPLDPSDPHQEQTAASRGSHLKIPSQQD